MSMFDTCLLYNIREVEQILNNFAQESFKTLGLHPTYGYIISLVGNNKITKINNISKELNLSQSTITRMVSKLIDLGYLKKGSDDSKVDISLTTKGNEILKDVEKSWDNFHLKYKNKLTAKELNNLIVALQTFKDKTTKEN